MKRSGKQWRSSGVWVMGLLATAGLSASPACSGNFLSLEDYQRDLVFGVLAATILGQGNGGGGNGQVEPGLEGLNCWDLNGNRTDDPEEDVNADGQFNTLDCQGPAGVAGQAGPAGDAGSSGESGINCWDLNGNRVNDPAEDVNEDGLFNALDCQGQGDGGNGGTEEGPPGINCWDLNGNRVDDPEEDTNEDGLFSALDCQGPQGNPGSGSNGSNGQDGVPLFDAFVEVFYTLQDEGSLGALEVEAGDKLPVVQIIEPALGANCDVLDGVDVLAYKVALGKRYGGGPLAMSLYLWREGPPPPEDNCFAFRLDSFRARHGTAIEGYSAGLLGVDNTRYIKPTVPVGAGAGEGDNGMLLVIDLPLNNTDPCVAGVCPGGLTFTNDLQREDLLAFELNSLAEYQDGACYTLLGVEFFESAPATFLAVRENAEVFDNQGSITCEAFVDCNNNGIDDMLDIAMCVCDPACADCNGNFVPDSCDIDSGFSQDQNMIGDMAMGNGIPDECEICPADVDNSGVVDPTDLALTLGGWGLCGEGPCPDFNGDCEVNAADVALLLGAWGPCPM